MHAAILSIGDELVLGQALDTNAMWLSQQLAARAVMVAEHRTVADERHQVAAAIRAMVEGRDLLIMTGGLGPTEDDLTRDALGDVVDPGAALVLDERALEVLERRFARAGRAMPPRNRTQAMRPPSLRCLANPHGTAPGLAGATAGCRLFALPGPPHEMEPMFEREVVPAVVSDGARLVTRAVRSFGLGESAAAERIAELTARGGDPVVGTTVSRSIVSARVRSLGPADVVDARLAATTDMIERAWAPYCFGRDDDTLAAALGRALTAASSRLVTAESCSGGWLGKRLVDVSGASAFYEGGWVTYANEQKTGALGVDAALLAARGAVSSEVAEALATGARDRSRADRAVSITGIAGPDGGTPAKPVGTVYIGLATPAGVRSHHFRFPGGRDDIRDRSVKSALQLMRWDVLGIGAPLLWEVAP